LVSGCFFRQQIHSALLFLKLKELLQNLQTLLRQVVEEITVFFFGNHFLIMLFQFFDFSIKISHRIFQFWRLWGHLCFSL